MKKLLGDAKKALNAVLEFYDEDTPPALAAKRVVEHLSK